VSHNAGLTRCAWLRKASGASSLWKCASPALSWASPPIIAGKVTRKAAGAIHSVLEANGARGTVLAARPGCCTTVCRGAERSPVVKPLAGAGAGGPIWHRTITARTEWVLRSARTPPHAQTTQLGVVTATNARSFPAIYTRCATNGDLTRAGAADERVGAAPPPHAGRPLRAAVAAAATVRLVGSQVNARTEAAVYGSRRATAACLAHPGHALLSLFAAVEAAAAVALVSLQVYAPAFAAGLGRTATVEAAATVALVSLQVYAADSTATLLFGAADVGSSHPTDAE
jgi:hypothetical protein